MAATEPSWILERNDLSNSESLCNYDASHKVTAQCNLMFGRRCRLKNLLKNCSVAISKMVAMDNRTILTILNLYVTRMPPIKFQLNLTYGFEGDVI